MKRTATAVWNGSGKEGKGKISTQSGVLKETQYSFGSRYESGIGTNPEELIAAAHAGCFTLKVSFVLGKAGFTPDSLTTVATVQLDTEKGAVSDVHLELKAKVPGITPAKFAECAEDAKVNCPISKLLNAKITLDAKLEG